MDHTCMLDVMIYYVGNDDQKFLDRKRASQEERERRLHRVNGWFDKDGAVYYLQRAWMNDAGTMAVTSK